MQPPNPTFSDYYAHQQPSQYYSYFPTQNPNPYPLHQQQRQLQIDPPHYTSAVTEPDPPGAEAYFRPSFPINHAGSAYNAHHVSTAYDAHHAGTAYDAHHAGTAYDAHHAGTAYDAHHAGTAYDALNAGTAYDALNAGTAYDALNASGAYEAHQAGGLTYSHTVSAVPPNTYTADLLAQNWAAAESAQQYGNSLYAAAGGTLLQDDSQQLLTIPTHSRWTNPNVQPCGTPWKKVPKKIKIARSAWCEVCKIECNTKDILYKHKLGRKHIKNIEKFNSIASFPATSTTTHVNPAVIGPLENPKMGTKKKAETTEDLEMKRRKVLEGGASANAMKTCGICNVVCNSDTVFRFHLAGQKHASMVKKS